MALIKCKECGAQVSTAAKACPSCGAKPPKKGTSIVAWALLAVFLFIGYVRNQASDIPPSVTTSSVVQAPKTISTAVPVPQWSAEMSIDKMTGKREAYASSPSVSSTETMTFPYQNVTAWMGVGCDGGKEWAYIGFSDSPNLLGADTRDGYNEISTRIKWNNAVEDVTLTQTWGSKFLHFRNDAHAIAQLTGSDAALLELSWYGQNRVYFNFSLNGSTAAIKEMRSLCSAKK